MARKPRPSKQALAKRRTPVDEVIATNLRRILVRRNVTREQLAERLGVGETSVDKYCLATARVSASRLWEMARALVVPITDFYEGAGDA